MTRGQIVGGGVAVAALAALGWLVFISVETQQSEDSFVVAATIFPLADIVRNVAGADTEVVQLIPSGADPHSYAPTPQLIAQAQRADVLFVIGHGLDNQVARALTNVKPMPMVVVDRGIALRTFAEKHQHEEEGAAGEEEHMDEAGSVDPHYWLTAPNAKIIAATVAQELAQRNPAQASAYAANETRYQAALDGLERELQNLRRTIIQRHFIAMHNAWSYFADHYDLELVATYEPVEGRTPSLEDLLHLREEIQAHGIRTFYAEPQRASSAATQFFAKELGLRILTLNAEGALAPEYNYLKLMRDNLQAIKAGE